MLCKNPDTMRKETATRKSLIEAVVKKLTEIAKTQRKRDPSKVSARVGRLFATYRIEKFFKWKVDEHGRLTFSLKEDVVSAEQALDGCYVIRTDVKEDAMDKKETVAGYMALRNVEDAFRCLKTVALEMRPIYHKTDERIRAHVFVCFLSYYLLWHAKQKLKPLFKTSTEGAQRRWSMPIIIERLKSIRREQLVLVGVPVKQIRTTPDAEQTQIVELLGGKLP